MVIEVAVPYDHSSRGVSNSEAGVWSLAASDSYEKLSSWFEIGWLVEFQGLVLPILRLPGDSR